MKHHLPSKSCLCVIILGALLSGCGSDSVPETKRAPRPVNAMQLADHNKLRSLTFSGEIKSHQTANLAFRVPGTVENILVKEGDKVTQGQVLARLDPHDFQVQINEIAAQLNEAKAAHKLAVIELKRTRQAVGDNALASINLDRATSADSRAQARVNTLQQSLNKAQDALRYSQLTAPFDGVIGQRFIDEHEQTAPGITMLSLHQPQALDAVVDVPEQHIGQMKKGMSAGVKWYRQDSDINAVSTEVASLPDPFKRTYEMTFKLLGHSSQLVPGKSISVELTIPVQTQVYCLPVAAVKSLAGQPQLVSIRAAKAHHVPVTIISQRHDSLCVTGELKPGDQVVTAGSALLKEGQEISVINQAGKKS
jgi:RND family efflux transporter MFP subunit